ncbi:FimB/Mfa2 family fimbrial subunit [Parabacteroides sp. GYB001]|uniref:FimB/Mfa2 family fimbrial subunit n=1 Tax=Parabacteroides leei TaxID=2939491 RepID=UPI00201785D7|nr:FimB/Mfa2 family fimbrial subunit [Parabacteroides leei]MCL3851526.1 FimB/Mfa2 family fimbrial subunit [Parabacteroides leei]
MKTFILVWVGLLPLLLFAACEKEELVPVETEKPTETPDDGGSGVVPEGYFVVTFSPESGMSRTPVSGLDGRVRHLRYLVYNESGMFVKEKEVLPLTSGTTTWPLPAIRDTLPKGVYTAVFLANTDKNLFPYPVTGGGQGVADVLLNYKGQMSDARIVLPSGPFSDTSEYYEAKVSFSPTTPNPYIVLQRIIGMFKVHRNFVDAQTALNQLVNNIVTQIQYKNYIQTTVGGTAPGSLRYLLKQIPALSLLDATVNAVADALLIPVTNALYDILLQQLVNQIGMALTGNTTQQGALSGLGVLLNPWVGDSARTAIVSINNFPKSVDLNNNVIDYYSGVNRFRFNFTGGTVYDEKDILIRGFHGSFDVRRISAIRDGLISGFLIENTIDGPLLLNGAFIDITDPVTANVETNRRYKADYSFLDLRLKSYTQQTDGNHSLTLNVKLGNIANIDGILGGIPLLGGILNLVLAPIKNITISVPVNLPLLGVDNLSVSGSWSAVTSY